VYDDSKHPLWKMDVGLWMYDGLSLFKNEARHITLRSPKRMLEREPLLRSEGLTGGIIYYDCATDDARLTLENVLLATKHGSAALTRCRVAEIDDDPARAKVRVSFTDEQTGLRHETATKGVIAATGVWTDRFRKLLAREEEVIRPTKGVHVVVPRDRLPIAHAVVGLTPRDQRAFFAIPWGDRTVLGTTDTDDPVDPSAPFVTRADVLYLLEAANHAFPSVDLGMEDIAGTWAGLRPLIKPVEEQSASDVPREHRIITDGRVVSVAGGKLTTYRRMAAETVDEALPVAGLPSRTSKSEEVLLPGADGPRLDFDALAQAIGEAHGLAPDIAERLANVYGHRATGVLEYLMKRPELAARLHPEAAVIEAEVVHAVERELALDVDDVLVRRTSLALRVADHGLSAGPRVAALLAEALGWSKDEARSSLERFEREVALMSAFRRER
jgi:glycerol-3-phosphate dehydrogenase